MSFSARLYETPEHDDRVPRHRTHIEATAIPAGTVTHYVVVHNLSTDGILVESHDKLHHDAIVIFDVPGLGRLPARVAWHGDIFYGCAFLAPIEQRDIDTKLAESKVVWADFAGRASSANRAEGSEPLFPMQRGPVAKVQNLQEFSAEDASSIISELEGRWPAGARVAFIIAAAAMLWAIIAGLIALIV